jgi:hypothetical protein
MEWGALLTHAVYKLHFQLRAKKTLCDSIIAVLPDAQVKATILIAGNEFENVSI